MASAAVRRPSSAGAWATPLLSALTVPSVSISRIRVAPTRLPWLRSAETTVSSSCSAMAWRSAKSRVRTFTPSATWLSISSSWRMNCAAAAISWVFPWSTRVPLIRW